MMINVKNINESNLVDYLHFFIYHCGEYVFVLLDIINALVKQLIASKLVSMGD